MRILITGAGGFLGCRLVERLLMDGSHQPLPLVRRGSTNPAVTRLTRLPVRPIIGDILDASSLECALKGCDAVVHCAYVGGGTKKEQVEAATTGAENLLRAARAVDVGRFVHISSIAVHGFRQMPGTSEDSPLSSSSEAYVASKVGAERVVQRHRDMGMPTVILRPTKIYGPYSSTWSANFALRIKQGAVTMLDDGLIPANVAYVDNVVDLVLLAIEHPKAVGETFIVSDDDPRTWRDYLQGYADMLPDKPALRGLATREIPRIRRDRQVDALRDVARWPRKGLRLAAILYRQPEAMAVVKSSPLVIALLRRLIAPSKRPALKARLAHSGAASLTAELPGQPIELPDDSLMQSMGTQVRFDCAKAKGLLGYEQRVSFDEALRATKAWLCYAGIIEA